MMGSESKLTLFISYVHEDSGISDALNNALQDAFGEKVTVFVDKVSIQQGENILETIKENLLKADVLVVISTGVERPSHDWAGFELGWFDAMHREPRERPLWGRVVTLCSDGKQPRPQAMKKYIGVDADPSLLAKDPAALEGEIAVENEDPLLGWFSELYAAVNNGQKLEEHQGDRDKLRHVVATMRKRIYEEYRHRPRTIVRPQRQLSIRYRVPPGGRFRPDTATIAFHGGAAAVFGQQHLADDSPIKWLDFVSLVAGNHSGLFWTTTLARVVEAVGSQGRVDANRGLIASEDQAQLFRLVPTRTTTYYDGSAEAILYLVDVYRRPDVGHPETTLLLKGLQFVCRFRFLFLERDSAFHHLNVTLATDPSKVAAIAENMRSELDLLVSDTIESGLDRPATWQLFGISEQQVLDMASVWAPLKQELVDACAGVLEAKDKNEVEPAKIALGSVLKRVMESVGPYNEAVLKAMAERLARYADRGEHL